MRYTLILSLLLALCIAPAVAQDDSNTSDPTSEEQAVQAITEQNNTFAFDMYRELQADNDANLVYSPYSISQAVAMAYAGASDPTATDIANALHYTQPAPDVLATLRDINNRLTPADNSDIPEDQRFQLNIANAIWGQDGFPWSDAYLNTLSEAFDSELNFVDYQSGDAAQIAAQINGWVAEQTSDKITQIVTPQSLTPLTRMLLVNAIYFNAKWMSPFSASATGQQTFTPLNDEPLSVQMMSQTGGFGYTEGNGYQALSMGYRNTSAAMLLILPDEFETFEDSFDPAQYNAILNNLERAQGRVLVPRFDFESDLSLRTILQTLGMESAFNADSANFNGMIADEAGISDALFIADAVHKATITVDEEGTEAAAATGVMMGTTSLPQVTFTFHADRPFLFLIYDSDTGMILFQGRVMNPTQ